MSSSLQNKLLQYSTEPPQDAWEKIASTLNNTHEFAEKLYQFEESPSFEIWNKINSQLQNKKPSTVLPFYQKHQTALRYVAAAAILIAIIVTAGLLPNKKLNSSNFSKTSISHEEVKEKKPNYNDNSTPASSLSLADINTTKIQEPQNNTVEKRNFISKLVPEMNLEPVVLTKEFIPVSAKEKQTIDDEQPIEKYMVYTDEEGNAMRVPKKLFDFINCVKANAFCKQQLQQLQQRLATADFSNDFTGVLELLKNLKENQ